jgi:hypothetical protein
MYCYVDVGVVVYCWWWIGISRLKLTSTNRCLSSMGKGVTKSNVRRNKKRLFQISMG